MLNKIDNYIFNQILKSFILIFFIFLSISWLLQLTRLLALTNLIQTDILNVIYLSLFLIPNLLTVIMPFIVLFGIMLCFMKLYKDKEIIAIYSLGLQLKPIRYSLLLFSFLILIFYISINFYISPKVYEKYKIKEFELRNTINFDKMVLSNFLKLDENTTLDFKKNENVFEDIFINFKDENENLIYAKSGFIKSENNKYIFQLNDGFKLSINKSNQIEKLEFENYVFKIDNKKEIEFNNFDKNTFTIIDDLNAKNFLNIFYKLSDVLFMILIFYFFYKNNIVTLNFNIKNNIFFILTSILFLTSNQLLKNSEINTLNYLFSVITLITIVNIIMYFRKYFNE